MKRELFEATSIAILFDSVIFLRNSLYVKSIKFFGSVFINMLSNSKLSDSNFSQEMYLNDFVLEFKAIHRKKKIVLMN